jgi:hypothetical protein
MEERKPSFLVWNIQEVMDVCTGTELQKIDEIIERVIVKRQEEGKKASRNFIVISDDDPYFKAVAEFVEVMKKQYGGPNNANN